MSAADILCEKPSTLHKTIRAIVDANKDKPLKEWFEFHSIFNKPSKQGYVGLARLVESTQSKDVQKKQTATNSDRDDQLVVFKFSQYINYLAVHEYIVMCGLDEIYAFCPHFCRPYGLITAKVDTAAGKQSNPFQENARHAIHKEVLLCEYIKDGYKFSNYIRASRIPEPALYAVIKQVLMAVAIAQQMKRFAHYDLHTSNVMVRACHPDTVMLYVLDEDNQFAVPTYGYFPKIIDYGFAFIENMNDGPLWTSLAHTDVGFMSDRFDWVADPKLFLANASSEIVEHRQSKTALAFRNVVQNMFHPLQMDFDSGWDTDEQYGVADYVMEKLTDLCQMSRVFRNYDHFCIDVLQSLLILPLEEQDVSQFRISFEAFLTEWIKIEQTISSEFYNLYVLKGVVDAARYVRAAYASKSSRASAVIDFRDMVHQRVREIADFCNPKNVHFERMLCSLTVFAKCLEGVMHAMVEKRMYAKNRRYRHLPLQSIEQMYGAVAINIETPYTYTPRTNVIVLDVPHQKMSTLRLRSEATCSSLNALHAICHGGFLYEQYKNNLQKKS